MNHPLEGVDDAANAWRLESPGSGGWEQSPRPGTPNKYFMFSADTHIVEPATLFRDRIDPRYRDRLPKLFVDDEGAKWTEQEGFRPARLDLGDDAGPEDRYREKAGASVEARLLDQAFDGVDREIVFPTKGLLAFSTRDSEFSLAQCRIYNDWVHDELSDVWDRSIPMAAVPTSDVDLAVGEVKRAAEMGFRGVLCPVKPMFGPEKFDDLNYNLRAFDPLWSAIAEIGFPVVFHVGTGRDPRIARKDGGAIINMVWGSHAPSISVVTHLCSSGVFDRHPGLRFSIIEAGIGWVPWVLDYMDQAYKKHHMWVRPKLKDGLPSDYFKRHGHATFEEDTPGLLLVEELGLENNFLWANDYPHYEGSWPRSAQAIERQMGHLRSDTRRKILGENAARLWGVDASAPEPPFAAV
jgi:predicted TIM-barrel fold metal-dependent hydrolase